MEIRAVVHFLWKKGATNKEIFTDITDVYGDESTTLRTIQRWTKRYRSGEEGLDDLPRSGRPENQEFVSEVSTMLQNEPMLSQKKISKRLGIHHSIVHRILTDNLGLTRVNFKWIPHHLNADQMKKRVQQSKIMLSILEGQPKRKLATIITGDETWIYMSNPRSSMWIGSEVPRPTRVSHSIGQKKVMVSVFWSTTGFHLIDILPPGQTMTKQYFINQILHPLENSLSRKRPKRRVEGYFLHLDNAKSHLVDEQISEMGFTRMVQPPYSPDLAPSDFFLFGYLKYLLEGHEFASVDQLQNQLDKILKSISKSMLLDAYQEWIKRLHRCIELKGEYV